MSPKFVYAGGAIVVIAIVLMLGFVLMFGLIQWATTNGFLFSLDITSLKVMLIVGIALMVYGVIQYSGTPWKALTKEDKKEEK